MIKYAFELVSQEKNDSDSFPLIFSRYKVNNYYVLYVHIARIVITNY